MTDQLAELRRQILDHYPIGSEWYDYINDSIVRVIIHFEPRGIVTRDRVEMYSVTAGKYIPGPLYRYSWDSLLGGQLITPRDGGYYNEFRSEWEETNGAFDRLLAEHGIAGETIWG